MGACGNVDCENNCLEFRWQCKLYFSMPENISTCSIRKLAAKLRQKKRSREFMREYTKTEKFKKYRKEWKQNNPEYLKEWRQNTEYYLKNKERIRKCHQEWYIKNKDKLKEKKNIEITLSNIKG